MIDSHYRHLFQRVFVDSVCRHSLAQACPPLLVTGLAGLIGVLTLPLLASGMPMGALCCLLISGYLDILDGSLARLSSKVTPVGAALDILSDRLVEASVIMGLFLFSPEGRALVCLAMMGAVLLCVTSFLVVGILTDNTGEKSFHYSPGLMERAEAFSFFTAMMVFPNWFSGLAWTFTALVLLTSIIRMGQFIRVVGGVQN